jgi:hypothetical protein
MTKERPILPGLINDGTTVIEQFQNTTLRPLIKMQHALLIASFSAYLKKRKIDFVALSEQKKRSKVSSIFKTDSNHKNITLGFIIGHFSTNEFEFYINNTSEVNKRILQIISQRIKDSILDIV